MRSAGDSQPPEPTRADLSTSDEGNEPGILPNTKANSAMQEIVPSTLSLPIHPGDHVRGAEMAPITLLEYGDFQSPACRRLYSIVQALQTRYGARLRFVFRYCPRTEVFEHAQRAAEAAECAGQQGKFWEMYDCLFTLHPELTEAGLVQCAIDIGLDTTRFLRDMAQHSYRDTVHRDLAHALSSGIHTTPILFINEICYSGTLEFEPLKAVIEEELLSANLKTMEERGMNSATTNSPETVTVPTYPFSLPPLRFAYEALEPFIDAETMHLHHDKHHQTYIDNLNAALKDYPQFHHLSIEDVMRHLNDVPEAIRTTVRNNGGGHANHQFFWKILGPGQGIEPTGPLADAINQEFGSIAQFKTDFQAAALKVFGSGWAFLVANPREGGKLKIHTTPNQDSVLLEGLPGLLACDVWEHAYYLKYQNRRADYLAAFWNVVDWNVVNHRLENFRAGKSQL